MIRNIQQEHLPREFDKQSKDLLHAVTNIVTNMSCCCTNVWVGIATVLLAAYLYVRHKYSYWKKRGVAHTPPQFPLGSFQGISRTRNIGDVMKLKYMEGRGERFVGVYLALGPSLLVRDPELIKSILVKDFTSFSARGFHIDSNLDPLTGHLFFTDGVKWRSLRTKLTPAFTSGKMKMMFPIIKDCSDEMLSAVSASAGNDVEIGDLFSRYTTNVVTRCAFGVNVDFFKNPDPKMEEMIDRVGNPTKLDAVVRGIAFTLGQFTKNLPLAITPKRVTNYFTKLISQIIEEREMNKIERKDFLQLLVQLRKKGVLEDPDADKDDSELDYTEFSMNDAVAQAFSFLLGGFDTSTSTLQVTLYELVKNKGVQDRLRAEISKVLRTTSGQITYEALQSMTYLDQVVNEATRLHPVVPILNRECTKPYQIPGTDQVLNPGDKIWISTAGMLADPAYFPQPELFDPDRFSEERKGEIQPCTFMPFGEGPRTCIGNRFAWMQMKTALVNLLSNFKIEATEKTPVALKRDPKKGLLAIVGGVCVKFAPV